MCGLSNVDRSDLKKCDAGDDMDARSAMIKIPITVMTSKIMK